MASLFRRGSRLLDSVNQTWGFVCVLYPEPARNPKIKHHCIHPVLWHGSDCVFKIFFILKYIKIIYFYFLRIIFNINTSKWFKNIKNILIWSKKKINFFKNTFQLQGQTLLPLACTRLTAYGIVWLNKKKLTRKKIMKWLYFKET